MPVSNDAITAFWSLFRKLAAELAAAGSADSPVYDELLAQLQKIDSGLYMEFCADSQPRELIVTAEGNRGLFPIARTIVALAPPISGWKILALKPKVGFPKTTRWQGFTLRISDVVFDPLERDGADLGLRVYVPGIVEGDVEDAHNAILRALDHGLGEERFAETVQFTEVRPLPVDATVTDYIPLLDIEKFIEWRESRRKGGG
jgi:hypothetical protein